MSTGADRDRLRAQLAGHLERLRHEGVWGLSIPEAAETESLQAVEAGAVQAVEAGAVQAVEAGAVQAVEAEAVQAVEAEAVQAVEAGVVQAFETESLEPVEAEALACVACRLHETRTKVVFGVGNPNARLMFIGEGPGRDEDLQGEPFVGRAGQLLTKIIQAMGYEREDVYIANAVKCRPPQNRDPQADEVAACRHFLMRQVALVQPEIIVLLGRSAVGAVLGLSSPLSRLRGTFRDWNGAQVMCTYHPAYLLRNPSAKGMVWEDMQLVRDRLAATTDS